MKSVALVFLGLLAVALGRAAAQLLWR